MKTRNIFYVQTPDIQTFKQRYRDTLWHLEEPFRRCKATVGYMGSYVYLRSYNTIVAFVDTEKRIGYDILRTEYGYTATSAQHIAKFFKYCESYIDTVLRTDYKNGSTITKVIY